MDEFGYVNNCCQCDEEYDWCECEPHQDGFEFQGYLILEPNVSICGEFLVDPEVYYGEAYAEWMKNKRVESLV